MINTLSDISSNKFPTTTICDYIFSWIFSTVCYCRAQSESNESSAEESSEDERKSKKKKKQSKKVKSEDDDEDLEKLPKKKSKSAFKHPFPELMTIGKSYP